MSQEKNQIECPNCGHHFNVDEIFSHQAEEKFKKEYESKLAEQRNIVLKEKEQLDKLKAEFEEKKQKENELFLKRVEDEKKKITTDIEAKLQSKLSEEFSLKLKLLEEENESKKKENTELKTKELAFLKKEQELKEKEADLQLQLQRQLAEKSIEIETNAIKRESQKFELREKELMKQIEDQKKLTEEMIRKQEQGSMQLQGEVQELAIEEWLQSQFPLDSIEEIKKGARGGDCIQIVNTRNKQNCGSIYYESKRTKEFSPSWIEKFKEDMRQKGCTFGVLVTEAMPKDMVRMGQKEGIWICTLEEFRGLSQVLRESIILLNQTGLTQENKGEKMAMLYDFLTGNEFRMQVEAIVDGFTQMQRDLDSEKRAMESIWKKREKQLLKVLNNTTGMYGSIKGIAGNAIGSIRALELPDDGDLDN